MSMKSKLLTVALVAILTLCLTACCALAFEPVAKEDLKVGFIYVGDTADKGYTYAHHEGTIAMQEALGLTDEQILIKTNVAEDSACESAMRDLVENGCQIIFGNSYGYMEYMAEMAEEYPEVIFSHCSGYMSNDVNFNNYFGAIYEARYLSGIAAGLRTETNLIGYVAAMPLPEVIGGFNAFALGAQSVNPDVKVIVKYTNSWYDVTLERQTAEALLDLGCDVIGQHCDSSMPQVAAEQRGKWGVGYNADMTAEAPNAHLTAPIWHWDAIVTAQVQKVIDGTWTPENYFFGTKEGLVDLSPLSANCAPGTAEAIQTAHDQIVSGELFVFAGPIEDNKGTLRVAEGENMSIADITGTFNWAIKGVEVQ